MLEPLASNPLQQFKNIWQKVANDEFENGQMINIATASEDGTPSARIVLFKDISGESLTFYTNYESQKGDELALNPKACGVVYWTTIDVQVRFTGQVEKLADEESDAYWNSRGRGSQIGAWASQQSRPLNSRDELENTISELERKYEGQEVPRPTSWGGFRLIPTEVQFLHRRTDRLHDSFKFSKTGSEWSSQRIAP